MEHLDIFHRLQERFGSEAILEHVVTGDAEKHPLDPFILVQAASLPDVCRYLHDNEDLSFDMLHCVSAVDWPESYESVYHLRSMKHRHWAILKVRVDKNEPRVPSVANIWPSADWHEREAYDLVGVVYEGHPNLSRLLLDEEWEGHPLRKDYVAPDHETLRHKGF